MEKYVYYNGYKFTRDDKTGYYRNSKLKERLHRYVWKCHHGEIQEGFDIHHIDGNKSNNDISNLVMFPKSLHASIHSSVKAELNYDRIVENLNKNALPAAVKWHKSDEGREWHKEHYEKTKDKMHIRAKFVCENCGTEFEAKVTGQNKFCSNKCKSSYRRKSGVDNETRKCEFCGKEFTVNKYSKARYCSKSCSNRANPRLPQLCKDKKD